MLLSNSNVKQITAEFQFRWENITALFCIINIFRKSWFIYRFYCKRFVNRSFIQNNVFQVQFVSEIEFQTCNMNEIHSNVIYLLPSSVQDISCKSSSCCSSILFSTETVSHFGSNKNSHFIHFITLKRNT